MKDYQEVETTLWNGGWIQVKVPLPFSLKWVNSYVIPEENGYTLIDPGLRTDQAIAAWTEALTRHEVRLEQIAKIIVTHQHPDHYGLAGYFQEKTGAPVYMSKRAHQYAVNLWAEGSTFDDELIALFAEHGMPDELTRAIKHNLGGFVERVSPQPQVTYIEAGQTMRIGGWEWQLIDTPGHASGHLSFYEPVHGWMLCGDQVLPRITPNVSVVPGEEEDPLELFLNSLDELAAYNVTMAFPGHRDPFDAFTARLEELKAHHVRRLDKMCELLEKPLTAFELCELSFGSHLRDNPHNLRFAMAETLAHLYYLERRSRILRSVKDGFVYYRTSGMF